MTLINMTCQLDSNNPMWQLKDFYRIVYAENSQILLKISVILILFHLSGSTESVSKQPTQLII